MKRENRLLRWSFLTAAILLLLSCCTQALAADTAATAFLYRNGVTWDSTLAEVLASEGVQDPAAATVRSAGNITVYPFSDKTEQNETLDISYYFLDGTFSLTCDHYAGDSVLDYPARLDEVRQLYGEPTETDVAKVCEMINVVAGGYFNPENMVEFAGWLLDDGTRVYLLNLQGGFCLYHFNEDRILHTKE